MSSIAIPIQDTLFWYPVLHELGRITSTGSHEKLVNQYNLIGLEQQLNLGQVRQFSRVFTFKNKLVSKVKLQHSLFIGYVFVSYFIHLLLNETLSNIRFLLHLYVHFSTSEHSLYPAEGGLTVFWIHHRTQGDPSTLDTATKIIWS